MLAAGAPPPRPARESSASCFRLVVAAPGSLTGRYPVGNTGGADVNAFDTHAHPRRPAAAAARHRGGIVNHTTHDTMTDRRTFSTDPTGLADGDPPRRRRTRRRRHLRAAHRARRQAARRRPGAHARLQRLDPGPDAAGPAGLGDHRPRPQRRRHRSDRPLARAAARQRLRRRAATRPRRRSPSAATSPTGCGSPTPACTGTTRTSARTTASTWACTATSSSTPPTTDYWPPVDRELVVTLDDVLVEDGQIAPFHVAGPTHVAMGRFGNVMLTAGETNLALDAPGR